MRILLIGNGGFLGSAIGHALRAAGHQVVGAGRSGQAVAVDFMRDHAPSDWLPRLAGIDAVVNAAGILREQGGQTFEAIHVRAPCALFAACVRAGVRRVVQISALGADEAAASRYHLSKKQADDFLLALPVSACVLQPSLVYGAGGASARLFDGWATLPVLPLPGDGGQCVQPVALDDLCAAVTQLVEPAAPRGRLAAVGPRALALRDYLAELRAALGLPPARFLRVPMAAMRTLAALGGRLPGALLDRDTLAMLERGNCADAAPFAALLGRPPHGPAEFVPPGQAPPRRRAARLGHLLPALRWSIAAVWLSTAWVSLFAYPLADSLALLARVGLEGAAARLALYGAAALDFAFGLGTLLLRRRRALYRAQMALIVAYTVLISIYLPEYWLHPYGPVLKNLPMLAALWLLQALED